MKKERENESKETDRGKERDIVKITGAKSKH
jgi:hypothetical protein